MTTRADGKQNIALTALFAILKRTTSVYRVLVGLAAAAAVARSARWGGRYLGAQLAEGHRRLEEDARHGFQDLEAPDVLQHNQQVAVRHHEG